MTILTLLLVFLCDCGEKKFMIPSKNFEGFLNKLFGIFIDKIIQY